MRVIGIDPRWTRWEEDDPRFEVHFFTKPTAPYESAASDEREVTEADVVEVLDWANREAAESNRTFMVYLVVIPHGGERGLIRLVGEDPNRGDNPVIVTRSPHF